MVGIVTGPLTNPDAMHIPLTKISSKEAFTKGETSKIEIDIELQEEYNKAVIVRGSDLPAGKHLEMIF